MEGTSRRTAAVEHDPLSAILGQANYQNKFEAKALRASLYGTNCGRPTRDLCVCTSRVLMSNECLYAAPPFHCTATIAEEHKCVRPVPLGDRGRPAMLSRDTPGRTPSQVSGAAGLTARLRRDSPAACLQAGASAVTFSLGPGHPDPAQGSRISCRPGVRTGPLRGSPTDKSSLLLHATRLPP
ncbi:hypothetical protein NDU88_001415 [Pleurodeles waltl]|uniref:Uncharacterized protein n=1 Tax=Pleurodeles waltl TaxID=8319 RepID=A0AAV7NAP9_PLEWA|nr:hypothetical protein NDU88_001415 [Pleurodeles waltl]